MFWKAFIVVVVVVLSTNCQKDKYKKTAYNLGLPPNQIDYAFILVRTGMRALDYTKSDTFPTDKNYKTDGEKWVRGELTKSGRNLMNTVGRSLETRYGQQMFWWAKQQFLFTSLDKNYAKESGIAIEEGLLGGRFRDHYGYHRVKKVYYDKSHLFEESHSCPAFDTLLTSVRRTKESAILSGLKKLFETIRENIGSSQNPDDEWYVNSLKQLYWLWDILTLERIERGPKHQEAKWMTKDIKESMKLLVKEYFKESMQDVPGMSKYLVGPLFNEIFKGYDDEKYKLKLHVHVTDERTFAAFKSEVLYLPPVTILFGETMIIEFYHDLTYKVLLWSPISDTQNIVEVANNNGKYEDFVNHYKHLAITNQVWEEMCNNPVETGESSSHGGVQ